MEGEGADIEHTAATEEEPVIEKKEYTITAEEPEKESALPGTTGEEPGITGELAPATGEEPGGEEPALPRAMEEGPGATGEEPALPRAMEEGPGATVEEPGVLTLATGEGPGATGKDIGEEPGGDESVSIEVEVLVNEDPNKERENATSKPNGVGREEGGRVSPTPRSVDVAAKEEEMVLSPLSPGGEKISLLSVYDYKAGDSVNVYLPGLPVVADITCALTNNRSRGPQFAIALEHGRFTWTVHKFYTDFLSLRRVLAPLRLRIRRGRRGRGRKRGYLPHLLTLTDFSPLQITRTQRQLPKCRRFLNAVLNDREFRSHRSTLKFLEISRLSFVEDLGSKQKEGVITKRSGGHRRVTNCLGCTSCCVCRCSVWRERWLVLKDGFLAYIRSDRRTIAGVLLFDGGMTVTTGSLQTGILYGLEIKTRMRTLLVKCESRQSMKEWKAALLGVMAGTGKSWVTEKRFLSFAPPRDDSLVQWFVDGESFMSQVASALLAAKEEIYITDWMMSPQIYLKRSKGKDSIHNLNFRLDKILLRKAREGVKVYIQIYKEVTVAIVLGSEYVKENLKHPNIVVFRHPEHITTGVYYWAHHEKIVVIDQTLAFVGGIDLAFGRFDDHCHDLSDMGFTVNYQGQGNEVVGSIQVIASAYKWHGKDYHNPFFRDVARHHEPFEDDLDRSIEPRMPWHDIAACMFGAAARDVGRHFIQRFNFTRHEQSSAENFLLPKTEFTSSEREMHQFQYLHDVIDQWKNSRVEVQILRSVVHWSAGTSCENSILNAYIETIDKAEHFIYIENQFFISSLREVRNTIVEALRVRIARAHRDKEAFRVIVVMPLLPSFNGDLGEGNGTVPKAIIHWNYKTISRGEDSLFARLTEIDGIPADEIPNYISVYGLRTFGEIQEKLVTELVYVHSKCMVVDDKYTIIGSANINDRSMLGERDSEMAIFVQDKEMVKGVMNGQNYSVGKFSHSLRCHLFREHLGLLEEQKSTVRCRDCTPLVKDIDVRDPACEEFYSNWGRIAARNMEIYEEVFGYRCLPVDKVKNYSDLKDLKDNPGLQATDESKARELLSQVQGFIVPMPLQFLIEEDLHPPFGTKEHYASEIFT